jgi:hypothetical protein
LLANFGKKAEKMANEEKEMKKSVSIKKDLHVMTPSVLGGCALGNAQRPHRRAPGSAFDVVPSVALLPLAIVLPRRRAARRRCCVVLS